MKNFQKKLIIIGLVSILVLPVMAVWVFKQVELVKAQDDLLSPLASKHDQIEVVQPKPIKSLSYYLSLANSFLEKATRLANDNPQQTEVDRLKIVATLNEALKAANQAISNYTTNPEGYLIRAKIFKRAKTVWPQTAQLADRDLNTARVLITQNTSEDDSPGVTAGSPGVAAEDQDLINSYLPDDQSPLNFIPTQQANLASNLTIAGDNDQEQTKADQQTDNNAHEGQAVIPAGETEVQIEAQLNPEDTVYVVARANPENKVLSVKAKTDNWFKVGLNSPAQEEVKFDYWIIQNNE